MLKPWLLRVHRWIAVILSIPFAVIIVTGLILSVEPVAMGVSSPAVTPASIAAALAKHDPESRARSIAIRAYDGTLSIGSRDQATIVDLASNERVAAPGALANLFGTSRRLHERLIYDLGWLVIVSTIAMLVTILIGALMGWPRIRNTVSGWHQGAAWFVLPLLILSPLTGLALAFGITFTAPAARPASPPATLSEALIIVGTQYDLSSIIWLRPLGGALAARVNDGGEFRVFAVSRDGLVPMARNWPRLLHEGNWSSMIAPLLNVIKSVALVILMVTGLWIWSRRQFRRRQPRAARPARAQIVGSTENA